MSILFDFTINKKRQFLNCLIKIFGKNIVFFLYDEDYMMEKSNFYMCSRKKEK